MIRGIVKGKVWSTKNVGLLPPGGLLEVETSTGSMIIAFDPLGCSLDEEVLITQGSVAANFFKDSSAPIDALIIGSIDGNKVSKTNTKGDSNV
jgi:ethanolamine utilization protein EutN